MTVVADEGVVNVPLAVVKPLPFVQFWKTYCFVPPETPTGVVAVMVWVEPGAQLVNERPELI